MSDQPPGNPGESNELASVLGQLWDIVRYAPIAIVLDGPALLPELAEKGKIHMGNARVLGARAVREYEPKVRRLLGDVGAQAAEMLKQFGVVADPEAPRPAPPRRQAPTRPVLVRADPEQSRNGESPSFDGGPAVDDLAILDYDSLPAAHVLNRLPGLSADELEAVRRYEARHRGRKTILNKVAQIQQAS